MAVSVNDLTVRIRVVKTASSRDKEGFAAKSLKAVGWFWANWLPLIGDDESANEQYTAQERATVTVRYTTRITSNCQIYLAGDPVPWDVIGPVSAVSGQRQFTSFKVRRKAVTV